MKKIICFLLIVMLIPSCIVYAENSEDSTKKYIYTVESLAITGTFNNNGNKYIGASKAKGSIESDYIIVAYRLGQNVELLLFHSDGSLFQAVSNNLSNLSLYCSVSGFTEFGYAYWDTLEFDKENYLNKYWSSNGLVGALHWEGYDYLEDDNPGYLRTNVPIFATEDEAYKYAAGELTEKDAINYETDLCNIKYDLETPQNMKAVRDQGLFDGAVKFIWTQTAQNYEEWETEFYVFEDFKYRSSFLTLSLADWKYAEDFYLFTEYVDTRKLYFRVTEDTFEKHDVHEKRINAYPCDYGGYYEPLLDTYYIRNHYFDGEIQHYSNWVVVTFDYESGDIVTTVKELDGSEVEKADDGNLVIGPSDVNGDSQYGDDYNIYSEESSSDIVNFIKNGFGLLGEDGVLTLLSQTFSFIPSELWSIFIAGMALMVLIAVAKFVRG